jgi:curved DNA-binding protein CbpA
MRVFFILFLSLVLSEDKIDDGMRRKWCGNVNCYNVLGLTRDADFKSIKASYRKLSREKHPDKCPECDPQEIQDINRAYEILSHPESRELYDTVMKRKAQATAPKESPFMAFGILLLIFISCVHQVEKQKQDQAKDRIISMREVRVAIKKNYPSLFEETSSSISGSKKKKKMSHRERKEFEEAAYKRISHEDLLKVLAELKISPSGYTGEYVSWFGTSKFVISYPFKLLAKIYNTKREKIKSG